MSIINSKNCVFLIKIELIQALILLQSLISDVSPSLRLNLSNITAILTHSTKIMVIILNRFIDFIRYPKDAEKHLLAVKSGLTRSQVLLLLSIPPCVENDFGIHNAMSQLLVKLERVAYTY